MNPDTNRFEPLTDALEAEEKECLESIGERLGLFRPDGSPVPKHWSVFQVGEQVVIKDYTFEVKYIGETAILFEPVGPVVLNEGRRQR